MSRVLATILCLIFILAGCADQDLLTSSGLQANNSFDTFEEESSLSASEDSYMLSAEDAKLLFDPADERWSEYPFRMYLYGFSGENIYFKRNEYNPENEMELRADYYLWYDRSKDQLQELGRLEKPCGMGGTVSPIIMQDGFIVYDVLSYGFYDVDSEGEAKMFKLDAKNKQMTPLEDWEQFDARLALKRLSQQEFITILWDPGSGANIIRRYDAKTDQGEEVLLQNETDTGEKILLEQICAMDGKIYATGRRDDYYLFIFSREGALAESIPIGSASLNLSYVIGEYLLCGWNFSNNCSIYKLEGGKVNLVVSETENIHFPSGIDNLYNSKDHPYIYYTHRATDDGEKVDRFLFALERATGEIKPIDVTIDNEYNHIEDVILDEYGNVILELVKDPLETLDRRVYYISSATIEELLNS